VKFTEEYNAEVFLKNEAEWHKACHLKFSPSKLLRLSRKQKDSSTEQQEEQKKSKRQSLSGNPFQGCCIFCSEVSGTLHNCATMELDHELRKMAIQPSKINTEV